MDPLRFPSLASYLSRLPAGIDSYPDCKSKGSMVRSALQGHDVVSQLGGLPEVLCDLVRDPPPTTRWVPLVHAESMFHLVCDLYYPTEEQILSWTYERTMGLATSPMYRKLLSVAGPRVLLGLAGRMYGLFERGTKLTVMTEDGSARVEISHPPYAHASSNQVSNVPMLRALIELTGGKQVDCKMTRSHPEGAVFECRWT